MDWFLIEFDKVQKFLDCFLNHLPLEQICSPLDYVWIQQHQFEDEQLKQIQQLKHLEYPIIDMGKTFSWFVECTQINHGR
jgi:hypothetical protein